MSDQQDDEEFQEPRRRIKIEIPEALKNVSDDVWEELEKFIFVGFLPSPARILNRSYVFKSLNHLEMKNIDFMKSMGDNPLESRSNFRAHFIAYSIFMVDGHNVLYERPKNIKRLVRIVRLIPSNIQDKIIENLGFLNNRAHRLYPLAEVYVHEPKSRYKWLQASSIPVHSPLSTGIPGTDELGMNYSQLTWTAMNRVLDKRELIEREWNNAKFIASTMSKGVRSIDEKDRGRQEKDRTEIEDLKMKVLHAYLNRLDYSIEPEKTMKLRDGRMATVEKKFLAESVEELSDQLSAALNGEKDHHDLIVEKQMKKNNELHHEMENKFNRMYAIPASEINSEGGSRVLESRDAAEDYISRMKRLQMKQMAEVSAGPPDTNIPDPNEPLLAGF